MKLWMAPQGLHVEPGRPEDATALARLHQDAFSQGWPSHDFAAYLNDPETTPAYIACDRNRRIFGFALMRRTGDEAELLTLAVARRRRGQGVGRALMEAVFADFLRSAVDKVFLEVAADNDHAIGLYQKLGFTQISTRNAYYPKPDGTAATALVMRRDLG